MDLRRADETPRLPFEATRREESSEDWGQSLRAGPLPGSTREIESPPRLGVEEGVSLTSGHDARESGGGD